jgi:hypothetical protein
MELLHLKGVTPMAKIVAHEVRAGRPQFSTGRVASVRLAASLVAPTPRPSRAYRLEVETKGPLFLDGADADVVVVDESSGISQRQR